MKCRRCAYSRSTRRRNRGCLYPSTNTFARTTSRRHSSSSSSRTYGSRDRKSLCAMMHAPSPARARVPARASARTRDRRHDASVRRYADASTSTRLRASGGDFRARANANARVVRADDASGAVRCARRRGCRRRVAVDASADDASAPTSELDGAVLRNFLFPALAGALFGWDIGISSGALENLTSSAARGGDGFALSSIQSGQFVSASLFGALIASAACGAGLGEKLGSRKELTIAATLYLTGALTESFAPGFELLVVAKLMYGLGIGFAMHSAPVYISETAPSSLRGSLVSLKEGFIVGGILLGYLASEGVISTDGGWRQLFLESTPLIAVLLAGSLWLPDSPRWIASRGNDDDATRTKAKDALIKIRDAKSDVDLVKVDEELESIFAAAAVKDASTAAPLMKLFDKKYARPLYLGLSVVLFQQFTGQPSVLYYATQTFEAAGWSVEDAANVSVILGVWKLFMTAIAVAKVDSLGRRPLLLGGVSVITASLLALAALNSPDETQTVAQAQASVACIFLYVGAYQLSFGPIAWLLVGEVFPSKVRSAAVGAATLSNFGSNFLVSLFLPSVQEQVGLRGTYLGFASVGVFALISIYFTVIETRGKTLEEIEAELTK